MEASEIQKETEDVMGKLQPRFERMDNDFKRWNMEKLGKKGSAEYQISRMVRETEEGIIGNDFRTFADDVQSILSSAEMAINVTMAEVQGPDMREAKGKLERLLAYAFEKADERLINLMLGKLKDNLVWYSIVRGWLAGRFVVYKDGKNIIFDFLPYDPRWLAFQVGANGLKWSSYTTLLSVDAVREEYGEAGQQATSGTWWERLVGRFGKIPDEVSIIEHWRDEGDGIKSNSIITNNTFLKKEDYELDSMPVLINPVATRPLVRGADDSEIAGYGDSIFAPNRNVGDLLDRLYTMWADHTELLHRQPLVNYYGPTGDKDIKDTLHYSGGVINLAAGQNKLDEIPMKEISTTLVNLTGVTEGKRIKGSLPDLDPGAKYESGTLYNLVQETGNRVYNPQVRNLDSFYSNACRIVEEQLLAGGVGGDKIGKFKIKGVQKSKFFSDSISAADIKREHIIKVEHTARTPWQQMDTYQVADMAKRQGIPEAFINEYILKFQDPQYLVDLMAMEMGDHSPKLAMSNAIKAYLKYGRPEEAGVLREDMNRMVAQEDAQTDIVENEAEPEMPAELQEPGGGI